MRIPRCARPSNASITRPTEAGSHPGRRRRPIRSIWSCSGSMIKPELEKYVGKSLGQIAQEEGKHPDRCDARSRRSRPSLKAEFLGPNRGFNADYMAEMINDSPYTFPGVSDGGAHTKFFTGGAYHHGLPALAGARRAEDHARGSALSPLALPAHAAGFRDRGMLREGARGGRRGVRPQGPRRRARLGRRGRA